MRDDGFTWWPFRFPLQFRVDGPLATPAGEVFAIRAWTVLLSEVEDNAWTRSVLAGVTCDAALNTLSFDSRTGSVTLGCVDFSPEPSGVDALFLAALRTQTWEAHAVVRDLAGRIGGRPATSLPPNGEQPSEVDPAANYGDVVRERGTRPPPGAPSPLEEVVADQARAVGLPNHPTRSAFAIPFDRLDGTGAHWPVPATAELSFEPSNLLFGSGLALELGLPLPMSEELADEAAVRLNLAEVTEPTGIPAMGAWCRLEEHLWHRMFIPSLVCEPAESIPSLVARLIPMTAIRARWARQRIEMFDAE